MKQDQRDGVGDSAGGSDERRRGERASRERPVQPKPSGEVGQRDRKAEYRYDKSPCDAGTSRNGNQAIVPLVLSAACRSPAIFAL